MTNLRKKIAQLGPQAPGAVEAANQRLVAALHKAKLALDAADDATKAKAYDALRKALTQAEYKASLDVPTHDDLLRVGMTLLAAKTYKSEGSSSSIKSKLIADIKAPCVGQRLKPAPRQRRDRDDAPIIPEEAFLDNAFDDRAAAVAASQANGSAPTNQRAAAGSAVQDADEAQQREQRRSDERWRAVAGSDDERSP